MESLERKQALTAALSAPQMAGLVRLDILTFAEAEGSPPISGKAQPIPSTADPAGPTFVRSQRLPVEALLDESSLDPSQKAALRERIPERSQRSASSGAAALTEAWELQRLSERYPVAKIESLPLESRAQLAQMFRDHERSLEAHLQQIGAALKPLMPVLSPVGESAVEPNPPSQ